MKRLILVTALLALAVGCPKVREKTYRFDVKKGEGEVHFVDIATDSPGEAAKDFQDVVSKYVQGTELEEAHPGWRIDSKELFESERRLDGRVLFRFDDPAQAGLYKRDKKSPYIWCTDPKSGETILSTNGTRIDDVLPGCVAWDRKTKLIEVTVKGGDILGNEVSLLPQYQRWKSGGDEPAPHGIGGLGTKGSGLGGFQINDNAPIILGALDRSVIDRVIKADMQGIGECYTSHLRVQPNLGGKVVIKFVIAKDGSVSEANTKSTSINHPEVERCIEQRIQGLSFPEPVGGGIVIVSYPFLFSHE